MARSPTTKIAGEVFAVMPPERAIAMERIYRAAHGLLAAPGDPAAWGELRGAVGCLGIPRAGRWRLSVEERRKRRGPRRPSGGRARR